MNQIKLNLGMLFMILTACFSCKMEEPKSPVDVQTKSNNTAKINSGWTWVPFNYNGMLWMRSYFNGDGQYDFMIGGGGCIEQMRYVPSNYLSMLSPSYSGEKTDRVAQWVYWGWWDVVDNAYSGKEKRFNINQAGTKTGEFGETIRVELSGNKIDIYSVSRKQWNPELEASFDGVIPSLVQYEMLGNGVLKVAKFVRATPIKLRESNIGRYDMYLESWTPFMRSSSTFDAMSLGLDGNGSPKAWWYSAGYNIPRYPFLKATNTNGYAVVFKNGSTINRPVIGVVFGKNELQTFNTSATGTHHFNSMDWNNGIGVLPALLLKDVEPGSIIEQQLYIVPTNNSNANFKNLLGTLVTNVGAPKLYGPSYSFTGEIARIKSELDKNVTITGTKTNLLGNFLP
jgi:hypothetical protein